MYYGMLSIEYPNMHSAPPTNKKAIAKLSMTGLPDRHASASGMNTTATTPSGNNQQSQYFRPPGGKDWTSIFCCSSKTTGQ